MKTFSVKLVPLGKEISVVEGTPLIDILNEYGVEFPCGGKGTCGRCKVKLLEGSISTDPAHLKQLKKLKLDASCRLACMSKCDSDLTIEIGQFESIIQADESSFEFTPGTGLGLAFDLGTTTLVGQLIDLSSGQILAVETAMNPQRKFGSDLISRIEAALGDGSAEMTRMIREKIGEMLVSLMRGHGNNLDKMVLVGNTVMHHFFCGYDIRPLSFYPFNSELLGMAEFSSADLGWDEVSCNDIKFYPGIGSFVGSDILAGILATGMYQKESYTLLIDLGTNGEIVLGNKDRLICASTAAGPAFEGANISQGMQATSGAISSISLEQKQWKINVIGNAKSRGICGSGLIDAVHMIRNLGLVGDFGEILSGDEKIALDANVSLSQKDIQEFQLAKAAIETGVLILLREMGIADKDLENVFIAGGFGNYINLHHLIAIGMLEIPVERMHKLGNSALMGAKMFLFEQAEKVNTILDLTQHISLEGEADFQDLFVDRLIFKKQ